MNHDEVQQLTNNNLLDLMSHAGDDHLEDGNIGAGVVCGQLYRSMASLVLELHWRRGDVGGRAPPLEENVKMVVESREKMLGWVT